MMSAIGSDVVTWHPPPPSYEMHGRTDSRVGSDSAAGPPGVLTLTTSRDNPRLRSQATVRSRSEQDTRPLRLLAYRASPAQPHENSASVARATASRAQVISTRIAVRSYARAVVEIRPADSSRIAHIAEVVGRAFVTEPMMTWPLGGRTDDLEERCTRANALFLEPLMDQGIVWETADGHGALVLVPPELADARGTARTRHRRFDDARDGRRRTSPRALLRVGRIEDSARAALASRLGRGRVRLAGPGDRFRAHRVRARAGPRKRRRHSSRDGHAAQRSALRAPPDSRSSRRRTRPRAALTSGSCAATLDWREPATPFSRPTLRRPRARTDHIIVIALLSRLVADEAAPAGRTPLRSASGAPRAASRSRTGSCGSDS